MILLSTFGEQQQYVKDGCTFVALFGKRVHIFQAVQKNNLSLLPGKLVLYLVSSVIFKNVHVKMQARALRIILTHGIHHLDLLIFQNKLFWQFPCACEFLSKGNV